MLENVNIAIMANVLDCRLTKINVTTKIKYDDCVVSITNANITSHEDKIKALEECISSLSCTQTNYLISKNIQLANLYENLAATSSTLAFETRTDAEKQKDLYEKQRKALEAEANALESAANSFECENMVNEEKKSQMNIEAANALIKQSNIFQTLAVTYPSEKHGFLIKAANALEKAANSFSNAQNEEEDSEKKSQMHTKAANALIKQSNTLQDLAKHPCEEYEVLTKIYNIIKIILTASDLQKCQENYKTLIKSLEQTLFNISKNIITTTIYGGRTDWFEQTITLLINHSNELCKSRYFGDLYLKFGDLLKTQNSDCIKIIEAYYNAAKNFINQTEVKKNSAVDALNKAHVILQTFYYEEEKINNNLFINIADVYQNLASSENDMKKKADMISNSIYFLNYVVFKNPYKAEYISKLTASNEEAFNIWKDFASSESNIEKKAYMISKAVEFLEHVHNLCKNEAQESSYIPQLTALNEEAFNIWKDLASSESNIEKKADMISKAIEFSLNAYGYAQDEAQKSRLAKISLEYIIKSIFLQQDFILPKHTTFIDYINMLCELFYKSKKNIIKKNLTKKFIECIIKTATLSQNIHEKYDILNKAHAICKDEIVKQALNDVLLELNDENKDKANKALKVLHDIVFKKNENKSYSSGSFTNNENDAALKNKNIFTKIFEFIIFIIFSPFKLIYNFLFNKK